MRIIKRYYFTIARKFVENNNFNHIYKYMTYINTQKKVKQKLHINDTNYIKKYHYI